MMLDPKFWNSPDPESEPNKKRGSLVHNSDPQNAAPAIQGLLNTSTALGKVFSEVWPQENAKNAKGEAVHHEGDEEHEVVWPQKNAKEFWLEHAVRFSTGGLVRCVRCGLAVKAEIEFKPEVLPEGMSMDGALRECVPMRAWARATDGPVRRLVFREPRSRWVTRCYDGGVGGFAGGQSFLKMFGV